MAKYEVITVPSGASGVQTGQVIELPSENATEIELPSGVVLQKVPDDAVPPNE